MNHFALKEQGLNRVLVSDESVSVKEAHEQPESSNGTNDAECLLFGIAVGTAVTGGPPRRSVREELPHTALALSRARKRCSG